MPTIRLSKKAEKFISRLPKKQSSQIKRAILRLLDNPFPHDSKALVGFEPFHRSDCGEYRIVYQYEEKTEEIYIALVGKRNDNEVYKKMKRLM